MPMAILHSETETTCSIPLNENTYGLGGDMWSVCFVSAISTSCGLISEDFSFSVAIVFSFSSWIARSSYLIIDARNHISWVAFWKKEHSSGKRIIIKRTKNNSILLFQNFLPLYLFNELLAKGQRRKKCVKRLSIILS